MNSYIIIIRFYGRGSDVERGMRFSAIDLPSAIALAQSLIRGYLIGAGFHAEITSARKDSGRYDLLTDEQIRKELTE